MLEAHNNSVIQSPRYVAPPDTFQIDKLPTSSSEKYQTLSGLLQVLRLRWKLMLIVATVTFALGVGVYFLIRSYVATTIVEINKDDPIDARSSQGNGPAFTADDIKGEVQTDMDILQSDIRLHLQVIAMLRLLEDPSFKKAISPDEKGLPLDKAPKTRDSAIEIFASHVKVEAPPDSRLITITSKSTDPIVAANIANTLARAFIDDTLMRRQKSIIASSLWLQPELADLKKKVQDSAQELADYERSSGLAGVEVTGSANGSGSTAISIAPQNTVTARLLTLNQELTAAEANSISTEAVNQLLKSNDPELVLGLGTMSVSNGNGGGGSSITPEGIQLISTLRAQEADLERQLSLAAIKYGVNNPRRIQLQQEIDSVNQQMQAEMTRIRRRAAYDFSYAERNEAAIREEFKKQEGAANLMADKSVKLQLLAQEAFSNQALYQALFSKLQQATLSSGTQATRIEIVTEAIPAGTPTFPKKSFFFAGLIAVAALFGVTSAFLRESADETIRTPQDLSEIEGLTMSGYIPRRPGLMDDAVLPGRSELIGSPSAPFSEAFRALRTSINLAIRSAGSRTVLVTSALGGAGKTTITYNLGVAFAQQGDRVLLIDGDLRNPGLHKLFSTPVSPGVSENCGKADLAEICGIVQHSTLPNLFILPAGKRPQLPSEALASPGFDSLLRKLSGQYDYVLVDSPPILSVTDASIIATKVRAVIAVVRSRNTTRLALSALTQAMQRTQVPVVSFVINDVQHPTRDGFYEYSYSREKEAHLAAST